MIRVGVHTLVSLLFVSSFYMAVTLHRPSLPPSLPILTSRHLRQSQKMSSSAKWTSVPGLASFTDKSSSSSRSTISASTVATRGPGGASVMVGGRGRGRVASIMVVKNEEEEEGWVLLLLLLLLLLVVVAVLVLDNMGCGERSGKGKQDGSVEVALARSLLALLGLLRCPDGEIHPGTFDGQSRRRCHWPPRTPLSRAPVCVCSVWVCG